MDLKALEAYMEWQAREPADLLELPPRLTDLIVNQLAVGDICVRTLWETCVHEAGHVVAAARGFCDCIPEFVEVSDSELEGHPGAEGRLHHARRPLWMLEPWQRRCEAVLVAAGPAAKARLLGAAEPFADPGATGDLLQFRELIGGLDECLDALVDLAKWVVERCWGDVIDLSAALYVGASHNWGCGRLEWDEVVSLIGQQDLAEHPRAAQLLHRADAAPTHLRLTRERFAPRRL